MLYPGVPLVTSRSLRSLLWNHLRSSGHPCIKGQEHQLARKEVTSPFGMDSRTSHETATSPMHASQEVHSPGTPAEGRGVVVPRRRLDHLRVHDNEGVLVGACLPVFTQQWQNLLCECRSPRILRSGILLKCHQLPLTRTPIRFPPRNKKQHLQKAVNSLLEKGAIEPVHRSRFLGFFSRLFLVPKKTRDLCPVIDLSTLNRHLIPHLQIETAQTVKAAVRLDEWTVSIDVKDALWKNIS